ncbi:hypothetical protein C8Q70DRAFT_1164170 [Cubamyces menziesii]|uniref:BTB domain-containing protein n=1 Tax=Trametes cubensis TaxID=1111947 RepID=A0AAD7TYK7_9APHY|nr:hypothetical protein C8Q70DRAFT_1164170 [Cubamyces menziesii]KAJ8489337.1 hypothetical protein ONZ51_g2988 [Trametes cubensis]
MSTSLKDEASEKPKLPRPPFDNPATNTILRSSDGVLFRVHSVIVAEASEVFAGMFAFPQPPRDDISPADSDDDYASDGTPIVQLEEDSETLDRLLRLCYPIADPVFEDPVAVRPVLAAALKYDMDEAVALLKKALLSFVPTRPLEAWGVACAMGLEEETMVAARGLCGPVTYTRSALPALRGVSAGQYWRLLKFIRRDGIVDGAFSFWDADPRVALGDPVLPEESIPNPPKGASEAITLKERPDTNITCRSSDGVEFHAHKEVLHGASSVLSRRIIEAEHSILSRNPEWDGRHPPPPPVTLEFDEPASTLSPLLELCYHACLPSAQIDLRRARSLPLRTVCALAKAAKKYKMKSRIDPYGISDVLDTAFDAAALASPLKTYLYMVDAGLQRYVDRIERTVFARYPYQYGWFPEMDAIPAAAFHELVMQHHAHGIFGHGFFARFVNEDLDADSDPDEEST